MKVTRLVILLIISFLLFQSEFANAQAGKRHIYQQMVWLRYNNRLEINNKVFLNTEIENRWFYKPVKEQGIFLVRPVLHVGLGANWSVGFGMTYFRQSPQLPESVDRIVVPEWRPSVELNYKQQIGERFKLGHRYRYEERFFRKTSKAAGATQSELTDGYNNNARFRYQLDAELYLVKTEKGKGSLKFKAANELMVNIGKKIVRNTFDQNRTTLALHYQVSKAVAVELGYIKWFQQRVDGDSFFDRDIARLTLHHHLHLGQHKTVPPTTIPKTTP